MTIRSYDDATHAAVPLQPTESQWGGLARSIVMWWCMVRPTGAGLFRHLESSGVEIPQWLRDEVPDVEHVPPKGTVAAIIYKAMISDAPAIAPTAGDGGGWYPAWEEIDAAVPGLVTKTAAEAVAKFAIDEYRSRGGQAGSENDLGSFLSIPAIDGFCQSLPESQHGTFNALIAAAREVGAMNERKKSKQLAAQSAVTVPAEVVEAAEWCAQNSVTAGPMVLAFLKSLQGAGHD